MNKVTTTATEVEATIAQNIAFIKKMTKAAANGNIGASLAITRAEARLEKLGVNFPVAAPFYLV